MRSSSRTLALTAVRAGQLAAIVVLLAFGRSTTALFFSAASWPWTATLAAAGAAIFVGARAIRHAIWQAQGLAILGLSAISLLMHGSAPGSILTVVVSGLAPLLMIIIVATMFLKRAPSDQLTRPTPNGSRRSQNVRRLR